MHNTSANIPAQLDFACRELSRGQAVVLHGDVGGSNRTTLVFAAAHATTRLTAFTIRHSSGLLTVTLPLVRAVELAIPPLDLAFLAPERMCVSVDAAEGTSTGISAADRARTARLLSAPDATVTDFVRPGHLMVVAIDPRADAPGFAEVAASLAVHAGLPPIVVVADLVGRTDLTGLAAAEEAAEFADEHALAYIEAEQVPLATRPEARLAIS